MIYLAVLAITELVKGKAQDYMEQCFYKIILFCAVQLAISVPMRHLINHYIEYRQQTNLL